MLESYHIHKTCLLSFCLQRSSLLFFGQMMDFIEGNFLEEQVESIKQFSDYVTNLKRVGPGLGEYQFDKLTLKDS